MSKTVTTFGASSYRNGLRHVWLTPPVYPAAAGGATSVAQRNDWYRVPKSGALVWASRIFFGHVVGWNGLVEYNTFIGRSRINPRTDPTVSPLITDNGQGGWGYQQTAGGANDFYSWFPQLTEWLDDQAPQLAQPGIKTGAFLDLIHQFAQDEHNAAQEKPQQNYQKYAVPFELKPNEWLHTMSFAANIVGSPTTYLGADFQALFELWYTPLNLPDGSVSPLRPV